MRTLSAGVHDLQAPPIYDWGSATVSSTRLIVGAAALPVPGKDYYIDFSYSVPSDIDRGAIAMAKFDATAEAFLAFESALGALGLSPDSIADRNVLYCKSAAYHDDSAFNTIFATALWHGEAGDVVFPRLRVRVPMLPGSYILFDCHEPHCFVRPGATQWHEDDYQEARYSHFLSFDLDPLSIEVRELFGLQSCQSKPPDAVSLRGLKVCPKSGAYVKVG
jgi:hypothetical protein